MAEIPLDPDAIGYDDELKLIIINQVLMLDFDDLYEIYRILFLKLDENRRKD